MITLRIFLFFCVCSFAVHAQKPPVKFGDVPLEDLKMTIYGRDSSASAVVLADYGESSMTYVGDKGFRLIFERLTRIKILSTDGLDWGNFSISLYNQGGDVEKISGLKAVTYNLENGKVVESKIKNDAVFREKDDDNHDLVKVTLPNVKVGSVVEISYKIMSDFIFNLQNWYFQYTIPARWSEYQVTIPEYFTYEKFMQGYISMTVNEQTTKPGSMIITFTDTDVAKMGSSKTSTERIDFQENHFRWVTKDVPAFKPEPFMTTYLDYISRINFELSFTKLPNRPEKNYMGTWDDINRQFAESADFGGEVTGNGFLKKTAEELTSGLVSPEEKMITINNYVKNNLVWDGKSRKFVSTSIKTVFENKKGNSAEINLLLASMLEKIGIEVSPVLLSTRDHGFLRENTPVSTQFNYTICQAKIADKIFLLDATELLLPAGTLPERCLNGKGLVVSKEGFKWVALQSPGKSKTIVGVDLELANSGDLKGKIKIERSGYDALAARKVYFLKGEADYLKDFLGSHSWELTKSEFKNDKAIGQPFIEIHDVTISEHVTVAGNMLYINPFMLHREEANPFKLEKREYPVDFGNPFDKMYLIKITLPPDYMVEEVPKSKALMLPNNMGKFLYNISQTDNTISVTSNFQINRSLFAQNEYEALRELYSQTIAKQAEQIVLKKK